MRTSTGHYLQRHGRLHRMRDVRYFPMSGASMRLLKGNKLPIAIARIVQKLEQSAWCIAILVTFPVVGADFDP
jgi:hypothetical protein